MYSVMIPMKTFIFSCTLCIIVLFCNGQSIKIETDKENYKLDELVKMKYACDCKIDSLSFIDFKEFKLVSGPNKSSSVSTINGKTEYYTEWEYTLRPIRPGEISIEAPTFFLDNSEIKGQKKQIKVINEELTNEELNEIRFASFIDNNIKPKGSLRLTINDEFGYVEKFEDFKWIFQRRLTQEEFELLRKVK